MSVTPIDRPEIQRAYYLFDTQDEAVLFVAGVKEDLAENPHFEFVDSDIEPVASGEDFKWRGTVDYIDRTPPSDLAA